MSKHWSRKQRSKQKVGKAESESKEQRQRNESEEERALRMRGKSESALGAKFGLFKRLLLSAASRLHHFPQVFSTRSRPTSDYTPEANEGKDGGAEYHKCPSERRRIPLLKLKEE